MRHAPLGVYGGPSLGDGLCLPAVTPVLVFFGQRSFTLEGQRNQAEALRYGASGRD